MTKLFNSIAEWQEFRRQNIFVGKDIGFVPTMGNLHQGHQSLLERSVKENAITVLSLFVNPTQFDNAQDLQSYPRTSQQDVQLAEQVGVDFILCPVYAELYPDGYRYKVSEAEFSQRLCGKHRPGHFDGVLTVVLKLLQLVKAQHAYFGEKDFQQLQLVRGMVDAFFMDTQIIACPTVRDKNSLALSSRNNRLTVEQSLVANHFPKLLSSHHTLDKIIFELTKLGFMVDYVEEHNGRRFGAVRLGQVRLIDNVEIKSC
jgi:pantoate--beta-alanine ligase